jgi:hypothetical protein
VLVTVYSEYTSKNGDTTYEIFNAPRSLFMSVCSELEESFGAKFQKKIERKHRIEHEFLLENNKYLLIWEDGIVSSLSIVSITDEGDHLLKNEIAVYIDDVFVST